MTPIRRLRTLAALLVALALALAFPCTARAAENGVQISWLGHSAFLIVSPGGTRVLIDPYPPSVGYPTRRVPADAVLMTSNLFDHKFVEMADGNPRILPGLTLEGEWTRIRTRVGDVQIRALPSYQDSESGAQRGKNSMFLLETGGLRILHAGNLGHLLDAKAVADLGRIDVLLVPVGGIYTLDGHQAASLVGALAPRIAIPMHFRTPALRFDLQPPTKFLGHFPGYRKGKNLVVAPGALPSPTQVYLLEYLQ